MGWGPDSGKQRMRLRPRERQLKALEDQLGLAERIPLDGSAFATCAKALIRVQPDDLQQQMTKAVHELHFHEQLRVQIMGRRKETKHLIKVCNKLQKQIASLVAEWNQWRDLEMNGHPNGQLRSMLHPL